MNALAAFSVVCFLNVIILRLACHIGGLPDSRWLTSLALGGL